jgi:hypothetical protein
MRGVPNNPVECTNCLSKSAAPKDKLCKSCRCVSMRPQKHTWNPEQEAELKILYANSAHNRRELTKALTGFVAKHRIPRPIVAWKAGQLGVRMDNRNPWTEMEKAFLRENAGDITAKEIARILHRSNDSVIAQMERMELSRRVSDGYALTQICEVLGVSFSLATKWVDRGWLRIASNGRIPETSVMKLLKTQPQSYDLRRVDQTWFKGMVFSAFGAQRESSTEMEEEIA